MCACVLIPPYALFFLTTFEIGDCTFLDNVLQKVIDSLSFNLSLLMVALIKHNTLTHA